jgi:predicted aspartyl protease
MILVTVTLPGIPPFDLDALVDSGADITTIPFSVLEGYNIAWDDLRPHTNTGTAGGTVEQRLFDGSVAYRTREFCDHFAVLRELGMPVVGQTDFYKEFSVKFDGWGNHPPTFTIDHFPSRPRHRA